MTGGLSCLPNKQLEAFYKTREKIDDTITSPEDYQEMCGRIDDLADELGEPTFKQWKDAQTTGDDP